MSKTKEYLIKQQTEDPYYEIYLLQGNGPDDCEWIKYDSFKIYIECIECATILYDKGHQVKIFDPFMGIDYSFPKDFK